MNAETELAVIAAAGCAAYALAVICICAELIARLFHKVEKGRHASARVCLRVSPKGRHTR